MKFPLPIVSLVAAAVALPAPEEYDGFNETVSFQKRATSFWVSRNLSRSCIAFTHDVHPQYANMDHTGASRGYAPDLDGDFNYPVYVAVNAGDGAGIQRAINSGTNGATRHPQWLASQPRAGLPISAVLRRNAD